ncbi:MAG: hypothetical protein CM1200mP30_19790 [Pseudomonadota bacterium]|nr:MAG: hypothetical protein CM1200mP30_19790 [Pseudomonadota bacterium]
MNVCGQTTLCQDPKLCQHAQLEPGDTVQVGWLQKTHGHWMCLFILKTTGLCLHSNLVRFRFFYEVPIQGPFNSPYGLNLKKKEKV